MLAAVSGYFDGTQVVLDEKVDLLEGQRLIITILEQIPQPKKTVDLRRYVGRGEKMFPEAGGADKYVRRPRDADRI